MSSPLPAVQLRVPTDEDALAWHRIFNDPDVMEFHGGKSAELSVYEELTARQRRHDAERGFCFWTMLDEDGEVIGFTGAQPWLISNLRNLIEGRVVIHDRAIRHW